MSGLRLHAARKNKSASHSQARDFDLKESFLTMHDQVVALMCYIMSLLVLLFLPDPSWKMCCILHADKFSTFLTLS